MKVLTIFSGHDASATVIKDGVIEYYFKEERILIILFFHLEKVKRIKIKKIH
jgi:predicted NodU family carbamoyl transferase